MPKVIDTDGLFEATVRVYADRGYVATTTQDIAARAGVNEVTLFRRYGSKAALIEAALTHCLASSPFGRVVASDDVRADLVAIVSGYAATNRAYGGAVVTLLSEAARIPELRHAVSVLLPNMANAAQIIALHQQRGELAPGDPMQKVAMLLAPLIAGALWARTGIRIDATEIDSDTLVDAFLDGQRP
jgi:AcrR family transcriptional regulator